MKLSDTAIATLTDKLKSQLCKIGFDAMALYATGERVTHPQHNFVTGFLRLASQAPDKAIEVLSRRFVVRHENESVFAGPDDKNVKTVYEARVMTYDEARQVVQTWYAATTETHTLVIVDFREAERTQIKFD